MVKTLPPPVEPEVGVTDDAVRLNVAVAVVLMRARPLPRILTLKE